MEAEIKILLADDDPVLLELLPAQLFKSGFLFSICRDGKGVLDACVKQDFDVVLLDVNLPDISGVELLSKIATGENPPEIVMLTADKSLKTGIEAMRRGAYDYITKPAQPEQVKAIIRKAYEKHRLKRQNQRLRAAVRQQNSSLDTKPIHTSESMKKIYAQAERVSDLDTTLLITGGSGTGKDVLARWIHSRSSRNDLPLVSINCGALPENLFESEFFGYEKGAFTGANQQKIGLVEAADGSTLFLDEIGEMPMHMQVKLLHFLENGCFRRVGSTSDRKVDARVIAATNKELPEEIEEGNFRADLFYRLNVISFCIPNLSERSEDIPALADHFLDSLKKRYRRPALKLSTQAMDQLRSHAWHGNIRELKNTLERTVALAIDDKIEEIFGLSPSALIQKSTDNAEECEPIPLSEIEKRHILKVLSSVKGKREEAALILGITTRTLYRKLKEYAN